MVKICFCAIFRNESKNVYRCLNGLKKIIDYISICDTGSTDNTVQLIKKWGKKNNIPTKVHFEQFKNFGYNRTISYILAKESFKNADYFLTVDADMVIQIEDNWDKNSLTHQSYILKQKNNYIEYWNPRLLRSDIDWKCFGVTHEYWNSNDNTKINQEKIYSLWIDDIGDGGCKDDKAERDERLLINGLNDSEEPEELKTRYMFYLAQTYWDMCKNGKALKWYTKRIERGGWIEEIFYSKMRIGEICENMKLYERASNEYLEAWNMRPSRAEPLYLLSKMNRLRVDNRIYHSTLCYYFSKKGKKISYPTTDTLFIDHNVYNYLFDYEISISAYYIGEYEEGLKSSLLLLYKDCVPSNIVDIVKKNIKCYKDKL